MALGGYPARDNVNPSVQVAVTTVPANPASGRQRAYIDSADGLLKRVDSSGTVVAVEFSDTKIVQLASVVVAGVAVAAVQFNGIPATYNHLRIVAQILIHSSGPVNAASLALAINSDGNPNYDAQYFYINATTTVNASFNTAGTLGRVGSAEENTAATATGATPVVIDIPNYAHTTFRKQWLSTTNTTVSPGNYLFVTGGEWRSTAAIARLDLLHLFGFMQPGSVISLYALN